MRERLAKWIAAGTIVVIAGLALLFARLQNPPAGEEVAQPAVGDATPTPARMPVSAGAAGRAVYDGLGCARCHSIAGEGSPRYPLDGVGSRREREEIRAWVLGLEDVEDSLSSAVLRRKAEYRGIPPGDLEALLDLLSGLHGSG
ncbi:MAG: c-type cytochrome [Gemmatimonadota bacterium]|nr:c-type cytochrome [Gemmatimonadota bacterium]